MLSMPQFRPRKASLTPKKKALLSLAYARAAIEKLEVYLRTEETEPPVWVLRRINQAATCFGQAVSFVTFKTSKQKEET